MENSTKDKKKLKKAEKDRRYYLKHKEKLNQYQKEYRNNNKTKIQEWQKVYRENNKENRRKYLTDNANHLTEQRRIRKNFRRKTDPYYKLIENIRSRTLIALKSQNTKKSTKTLELLGASKEEVWKHLESKFKEGMTRENHGFKGWHIDHLLPCASFDLSDPEEQKKCFHYTNLQPLWWWENLKKNDKIIR
jgi:hypothetical protein